MSVEESTEQRIGVEKVIPHPDFNEHTLNSDFMLIKLKEPAVCNEFVKPIPLATRCSCAGEQCLVSGWGLTEGEILSNKIILFLFKLCQCFKCYLYHI